MMKNCKHRVIIFKGHHDNTYYRYDNQEDWEWACLEEVKRREEECHYADMCDEKPYPPFSEQELKAIPESLKKAVQEKIKEYESDLESWKKDDEIIQLTKKVIEQNDVKAAVRIIQLCRYRQLPRP